MKLGLVVYEYERLYQIDDNKITRLFMNNAERCAGCAKIGIDTWKFPLHECRFLIYCLSESQRIQQTMCGGISFGVYFSL